MLGFVLKQKGWVTRIKGRIRVTRSLNRTRSMRALIRQISIEAVLLLRFDSELGLGDWGCPLPMIRVIVRVSGLRLSSSYD